MNGMNNPATHIVTRNKTNGKYTLYKVVQEGYEKIATSDIPIFDYGELR